MADRKPEAADTTGTPLTGNGKDGKDTNSKKAEPFMVMLVPHTHTDEPDPKPEDEDEEVPRALECKEFGRMLDFGLGRGVNATHKSPWFQKSTLQVREVGPHNIIGTEEGGILKSFVREIWSVEEVQARLDASVPVGGKVSIKIDAELSRNYNTTRRSVGQHLVTRTISFKPNLEHDQPQQCDCPDGRAYDKAKVLTFEERLSTWIIEKANKKSEKESGAKVVDLQQHANSCAALADFIANPKGVTDVTAFLEEACLEYIETFNITHYVSGIQLGAAKYEVLSEEEYLGKVGTKSQLQVLQLASVAVEGGATFNQGGRESAITEIGRFQTVKNGATSHKNVKRGSADEAVVGVEFEPISVLVGHPDLRKALSKATSDYIEKETLSKAGPFIISCNNEELFLKVKKHERRYEVIATRDLTEASNFHISYNEDGLSAYEFSIAFFDETRTIDLDHTVLEDKNVEAIPRYLYAPLKMFGTNDGPLTLRLAADDRNSQMTLQNRRVRTSTPADTKDWMTGQDVFYICCRDRSFFKDSYICVRDRGDREGDQYITCCVTSIQKQELPDHHMLFRLMRSIKKKHSETSEEPGKLPVIRNLPFGKPYRKPYEQRE